MPVPPFDLLKLVDPTVDPTQANVQLAGWHGREHPLDEYLAGRFEEWQRWQGRRNFEQPVVLSLLQYQAGGRWLFAGLFDSLGGDPARRPLELRPGEWPTAQAFRGWLVV